MSDVQTEPARLEIAFHNDDHTPLEFVVELLHSVFDKQAVDAVRLTQAVSRDGLASCGTYPREVAIKLLEAARERVRVAGHPLRITSHASPLSHEIDDSRCKLCGEIFSANQLSLKGRVTFVCDDCLYEVASKQSAVARTRQFEYAYEALEWHFAGTRLSQLVATSRQFPGHMRADVQSAIDRLFSVSPVRFFGIHEEHRYETLTIATLTRDGRNACAIAPAQYHDVDVGESVPVKCLNNGLWLCKSRGLRYAVVLSAHRDPY